MLCVKDRWLLHNFSLGSKTFFVTLSHVVFYENKICAKDVSFQHSFTETQPPPVSRQRPPVKTLNILPHYFSQPSGGTNMCQTPISKPRQLPSHALSLFLCLTDKFRHRVKTSLFNNCMRLESIKCNFCLTLLERKRYFMIPLQ